jgi:hypothetical protein
MYSKSGAVSESPSDFGGRLDSFVVLTLCQDNRMDKPRQKGKSICREIPSIGAGQKLEP